MIKAVRTVSGLGLKEAKQKVDALVENGGYSTIEIELAEHYDRGQAIRELEDAGCIV